MSDQAGLSIAQVGYTSTDDDRGRVLKMGIWLRRNAPSVHRRWCEDLANGTLSEDCIDLNGPTRRDFLEETRRYDIVATHHIWGYPTEEERGGCGPTACSIHHSPVAWRERLYASGASFLFLFGPHFNNVFLAAAVPGYESYSVPLTGSLDVLVAKPLCGTLPAPVQTISYREITAATLEALPELSLNRNLDLSYTDATSEHFARLERMRRLEDLRLVGVRISDRDMEAIARCVAIRRLNLDETGISGTALAHLKALATLECLSLNHTRIDDSSLCHLKQMGRLEWLSIVGTEIGDRGADQLQRIKTLRWLSIAGARITAARVEALQQALPECAIAFSQ